MFLQIAQVQLRGKMTNQVPRDPISLLEEAVSHLRPVSDRQPWDYGWAFEDYRHSDNAALSGADTPLTLDAKGIQLYEQAVAGLLQKPAVKERWDPEEFWGFVASLVATAHRNADAQRYISEHLHKIEKCGPSLVVFDLANTAWKGPPIALEHCILGNLGSSEFEEKVAAIAGNRHIFDQYARTWISERLSKLNHQNKSTQITGFACWPKKQMSAAVDAAEREFDDLVGLCLLLEPDLEQRGLFSCRGNTHRPGVRGLVLDRDALSAHEFIAEAEMIGRPVVVSDFGSRASNRWYSGDPFPLYSFLEDRPDRIQLSKLLYGRDVISKRTRVAAKWFAEAHWAFSLPDMVLALGVALDALLGSRAGLPGRVISERFALLEPQPDRRKERARRFDEIYRARSAVAHGGESSRATQLEFVRNMAKDTSWTAQRMVAVAHTFNPAGEAELDAVFADLRWGTREW